MDSAIIEIDVHGMKVHEAVQLAAKKADSAGSGVYKIRVIHGYHGGTGIRDALWDEFSYGRHEKVKRVVMGANEGITELILKEMF